ncbi:sulfite exporter TauE/SafE family protein [Pseudoalteromonas sp. McH1-7]|uniref:sulfite exporter TauE/SafE family protein n=1 Tax=Pseudoalteromonas TaxID=53246 RepID=UPI001590434A|nr:MULTISPECIES: sulfite exporter TauE/SafE family protein [Pseudoalteromonas]MDW7548479.1 sulfite exporter TauE/SafE family protein [Pseudoalteromonas peptidolytica]NUZ12219.1 sulfite exporter TauE/SafE family protein [Pseudoalteromonas sp. McH1-7]USD30771.1 sulfite exporter TauE/SafE family protein [Pseudoalteromonas sp. SCSIO 43201]
MTEPLQLVVIALVVLLSGISKSGFAGALGAFSVPLLLMVLEPKDAVALMLPILIVADVFSLKSYWKQWNVDELKRLLPGTLLGIALATIFLQEVSEFWLTIVIALMSIGFALKSIVANKQPEQSLRFFSQHVLAISTSTMAGISTTLIHAGGPPLMIYFNALRVAPAAYIATVAVLFALMNAVKLVTFTASGLLQLEHFLLAVCFTPIALIGNRLGVILAKTLPRQQFLSLMNWLLLILGLALVIIPIRLYICSI